MIKRLNNKGGYKMGYSNPELLEALKQILEYHERGVEKSEPVLSNYWLNVIKQAIAKAEGNQ